MGGLAEFFMGAVGGAAQAGVDSIVEKEKAEIERQRQEQLSRLRMQEHATNKAKDIELADKQAAAERDRRGEFFKANKLPDQEIEGVEVDASGKEIGKIKGDGPADRKDQAEHYARKALETGDKGLVEMAQKEAKDIRDEEQSERRDRAANNAADAKAREAAAKEEQNRIRDKQVSGYLAKLAAGAKGGNAEDTANIKDIKYLAKTLFDGDEKRAAIYKMNGADRSLSQQNVLALAKLYKEEDYNLTTEEAMTRAEKKLRASAEASGSRGGVNPGVATPKPEAPPAPGRPWEKFKKPGGN